MNTPTLHTSVVSRLCPVVGIECNRSPDGQ